MSFRVVRADLLLEDEFTPPAFELVDERRRILSTLYERLVSNSFPLSLSDIQSPAASTLADVKVQLSTFGGVAKAELHGGGLTTQGSGIVTEGDREIIWGFMTTVDGAVQELLGSGRVARRKITEYVHLRTDMEGFDAQQFVNDLASGKRELEASRVGADRVDHRYDITVSSDAHGWETRMAIEPSVLPEAALFAFHSITYTDCPSTPESLADAEKQMQKILYLLGIEVAS